MSNAETKLGVFSGLGFIFIGQVLSGLLHTILLAALGATVSFLISRFLQWLFKRKD